jgi:hypothetical protein
VRSRSIAGSESPLCLPARLPTRDAWTDRRKSLEVGRCRPGSGPGDAPPGDVHRRDHQDM